ncbi:MAG: ferredoxin--NADP reductase [Gammaproteobacteria bacterium]|nr:ferredoxin--NADP reductase [Gammaproteobacteria bacterium]
MAQWHTGTVIENARWNDRLTTLRFEAPLGRFEPGQFVRVGLEIDGEIVARPYSLVNTPNDSVLEIYFNIVADGPLSPRLFALKPGDKLLVSDFTTGFFTMSEVPASHNLWMLATGTAIGPHLSILKDEVVWKKFDRVTLCYSVRTSDELSYTDTITEIAAQHGDAFCFVPLITGEAHLNALNERIPQSIQNGNLESRAGVALSADDSHVMICGSSDMIADVTAVLESRGMRKHRRREPGHYTTEKYH